MIGSFGCKQTEKLYREEHQKKFGADIEERAATKLMLIAAARKLDDLKIPPGNQLEALSGDRKGQHSIRINRKMKICFVWKGEEAFDVEIVDYH